jgi:hypothetical protein
MRREQERFEGSALLVEEAIDSRTMGRAETDSFLYEFSPRAHGDEPIVPLRVNAEYGVNCFFSFRNLRCLLGQHHCTLDAQICPGIEIYLSMLHVQSINSE